MGEVAAWAGYLGGTLLLGFAFAYALAKTLVWYRHRRPRTLAVTVKLRTGDEVDIVARYTGVDPADGLHTYLANLDDVLGVGVEFDGLMMPQLPAYTKVGLAGTRRITPEDD